MSESGSDFQPEALLSSWFYHAVTAALFAVALAGQRRFHALLLTWLQVERMALRILNDVLLQDLALEAPIGFPVRVDRTGTRFRSL